MLVCACFRDFSLFGTIADGEHAVFADADDAVLRAAGDRVTVQTQVDRSRDQDACADVCYILRQVIIAVRQGLAAYIAVKRGIDGGRMTVSPQML